MTAPESWHFPPGTRIERYTIVRGVARGGMGEVYLATWQVTERLRRAVAIKRLTLRDHEDTNAMDMFMGEIQIGVHADHPGVVRVLDVLEWHGEHLIVMEYVHGCSLRRLLRGPRLELRAALHLLIHVADALDHVHRLCDETGTPLGVIHRDVSPDNIMVSTTGTARLIDFGIARSSARMEVTLPRVLKGKVGYMSPEQLRCDPLDARSDVFQLGIVAYELLTGRRLFKGDNPAAVMNQVLSDEIVPPQILDSSLDPDLCEIVMNALAFDPEDRHPTAADLSRELESFATRSGLAPSPEHVIEHLRNHVSTGDLTPDPSTASGQIAPPHPQPALLAPHQDRTPSRWRPLRWAAATSSVLAVAGATVFRDAALRASDEATMATMATWSWSLFGLAILTGVLTAAAWRLGIPRGAR